MGSDNGKAPRPVFAEPETSEADDAAEAASGRVSAKPDKSEFRRETWQPRPADRLRREDEPPPDESAPDTSGQVGPKSKGEKKAAKEARRTDKSKLRAEKSAAGLTAAKEKLAAQKPQRPPGAAKTLTRALGHEVWAKVHGKIHELERENVGTEAAHRRGILLLWATTLLTRFSPPQVGGG